MSFRSRIWLIVLLASVVPLALVGLWLTGTALRSGERLLERRLEQGVSETVSVVTIRWTRLRSALLTLAESPEVRAALGNVQEGPTMGTVDALRALDPGVLAVSISDTRHVERWHAERPELPPATSTFPPISQTVPLYSKSAEPLGTLVATLSPEALLPPSRLPTSTAGMLISLVDANGVALSPVPFDPRLAQDRTFEWGGDRWMAVRRQLEEPTVEVLGAATLGPFVGPFEETARQGGLVLLGVAVVVLVGTAFLTSHLTRDLRRLSEATVSVSQGDLDRRLPEPRRDEVGQVTRAFNRMTENLRRTVDALAAKESMAAVGEFAAGLAHEIRNPLTAIQVDLQYVEEQLPPDSPLREAQGKALAELGRLDATVRDALKVARSGQVKMGNVDLRDVLRAAAHAVVPSFDARQARLEVVLPETPLALRGDAAALEQLFLNLLRNAAEALPEGGLATLRVTESDGSFQVVVEDSGPGMSPEVRSRAFEPLFSTRTEGTGLGLPIAQRIAAAHGGSIQIEGRSEGGTRVTVWLPTPHADRTNPVTNPA
jgi:signal transduction histidine kinase